ncbi:hypothetical protein BHE74_00022447 [Ensete ventricosum]|nr:hypothetical protein BHE74_00022447 [Ensete ventricosum]
MVSVFAPREKCFAPIAFSRRNLSLSWTVYVAYNLFQSLRATSPRSEVGELSVLDHLLDPMTAVRVTMEIGSDGVAVITICNPPVNALAPSSRSPLASLEDLHVLDLDLDLVVSGEVKNLSVCILVLLFFYLGWVLVVIAGLKEKYTEAMNRSDVKAIVLTGEALISFFVSNFVLCVMHMENHTKGNMSLLPDVSVELVVNTIEGLFYRCLFVHSVTDVGLRPRKIKRVAVIGGGLMGSGIATALILSNTPVILKEIDSNFLQKGLKMIRVHDAKLQIFIVFGGKCIFSLYDSKKIVLSLLTTANLEGLVKKGSLTQDKMNKALSLLKGALDYSEFKHVDMVIEASL